MKAADKTVSLFVLLAAALVAVALVSGGCGGAKKDDASSSTTPRAGLSASEALARAKADGIPVVLCFHSDSCQQCKKMKATLEAVGPEYEGKAAIVEVDVYDPSEAALVQEYGIETIPTTFFVGKDGGVVSKHVGAMGPDKVKAELDSIL